MRHLHLAFLALAIAAAAPGAEVSPVRAGPVSFELPSAWKGAPLPNLAGGGVVYRATGPDGLIFTLARLPASAAPAPLPGPRLDALTIPETAAARVALQELGLTPTAGFAGTKTEGSGFLTAVDFDCAGAAAGEPVRVLTCTWATANEVWRARLQYSLDHPAPGVEPFRASFRFANLPTAGFGDFGLAQNRPIVAATPPAPVEPESPPRDSAALVQRYRGSLVIIEGGGGAGSGFLCRLPDGVFMVTNQHVASEMPSMSLASLDRTPVPIGAGSAAVGHDIIRFATNSTAPPLLVSTNVDADARIGDPIVVLGNSEGARVVAPLAGRLAGIGPDRVEVTAEFVPGNSGSPIIHLPTGKVIGIATYLTQRQFTELTDGQSPRVRRFGYRLDSVRTWQPVAWAAYRGESVALESVAALTKDFSRLIGDLGSTRSLKAGDYARSTLFRPVRDFQETVEKKALSPSDRSRAVENFLASLRSATQADIARQRQVLHYDYFQRELSEQAEVRAEMFKLFDRLMRANGP